MDEFQIGLQGAIAAILKNYTEEVKMQYIKT